MANTLTYLRKDIQLGQEIWKVFTCLLSGSYTNGGAIGTPGETLSFNTAAYTGRPARIKIPGVVNGSTAALPKNTDFEVFCPAGFTAQVEQNSALPTPANYALRIFAGGSGNAEPTELTSATYASQAAALLLAPLVIKVRVPQKYA